MKIGDNVVLVSDTIFIPIGEKVEIQHQIAKDDFLNCRFLFLQDIEDKKLGKQPFVNSVFKDNWFDISFCNFTQPLGATTKPLVFGISNKGEQLSLIAGVYKLTELWKIEFQIMMKVLP